MTLVNDGSYNIRRVGPYISGAVPSTEPGSSLRQVGRRQESRKIHEDGYSKVVSQLKSERCCNSWATPSGKRYPLIKSECGREGGRSGTRHKKFMERNEAKFKFGLASDVFSIGMWRSTRY